MNIFYNLAKTSLDVNCEEEEEERKMQKVMHDWTSQKFKKDFLQRLFFNQDPSFAEIQIYGKGNY